MGGESGVSEFTTCIPAGPDTLASPLQVHVGKDPSDMLRLHVCWLIRFQDCREAPLTSIEHESISVVFRLTIRYQEHMSECGVELLSFVGRWSLRRT